MGIAEESAEKAGSEAALEAANEASEDAAFLEDLLKMCEEEGRKKGDEIYGEYGAKIGAEAGVMYGRKAAIAKIRELVEPHAIEMGKIAGLEAGKYTCTFGGFRHLSIFTSYKKGHI